MIKTVKARAKVKVYTEFGKWCLAEIRGLKEGTVLLGKYNPVNKAFDFTWNGEGAMLWIGENGLLLGTERPRSNISTPRNNLRRIIRKLDCNKYIKLITPVTVLCHCDDEFATQVKITEVGRNGKLGHCKLVNEFEQLFSINEISQQECTAIIDALPDYMKTF